MTEGNFVDYVKMHLSSGKGGQGSAHLRREKYIPKGGEKLEKLPGETTSKAKWRIATEARAAIADGTATPKQIKIVEDLDRWNVGQAIRAAENRVYTEGGKSNRDFSFLE